MKPAERLPLEPSAHGSAACVEDTVENSALGGNDLLPPPGGHVPRFSDGMAPTWFPRAGDHHGHAGLRRS